jgi:hypothetical protein
MFGIDRGRATISSHQDTVARGIGGLEDGKTTNVSSVGPQSVSICEPAEQHGLQIADNADHLHRCDTCQFPFSRVCDLRSVTHVFYECITQVLTSCASDHINRKHDRRFRCTFTDCTQAFHLRTDLARHIPTHLPERGSIPCRHRTCGKSFGRRDNMLKHFHRHHGKSTVVTPSNLVDDSKCSNEGTLLGIQRPVDQNSLRSV